MILNMGKFADNGKCGYVLKPLHLRQKGVQPKKMKFKIQIISARQLPKPGRSQKGEIIDPYVELEIIGKDSFKVKTKVIDDNGFNPTWEQSWEFDLEDYESDILRFVVMDKDVDSDDFIASNTLALNCLAPGYRTLPLIDVNRDVIPFCSLYIHSTLTPALV
jgi:inactive phospholipase C-like protein 2